ncbi:MAG: TatD family hydrolase [Mariprofundales bacterium]
MTMFDSHCHLDFPQFDDDREQVMARMTQQGIAQAVLVAVDLDHMDRLQACCSGHDGYHFSLGLHPNHEVVDEPDVAALLALAQRYPEIVAIGETGLDYFHHRVDPTVQQSRFRAHLTAAAALQLPVIVHMREADGDTLDILDEFSPVCGVMHCFSSDMKTAQRALDLDMYISFSGNVTFKRNNGLREVAAQIPLERLLIETDSPYLAPVPMRGKRNEPTFVAHVAKVVAEARAMTVESLAAATTTNAQRFFSLAQ